VKRTGRDEPIWVVTHMHGNNTRKLPMYYLYLKLAKTPCSSMFYVFSSTKLENRREEQFLPRAGGGGWYWWEQGRWWGKG
jgi:hypothetical protein